MTVEKAAFQMQLLGHKFFMFMNTEAHEYSLLYRRDDGDLGMVQPESAWAKSTAETQEGHATLSYSGEARPSFYLDLPNQTLWILNWSSRSRPAAD